ncbi:TPA: LysE family translocator [Pseudomonas aeruginosa]|uniref:LysE family translocator n=1 Tax=Pseudomonas aeruginosa TaxID=287 RepID=UPI00071C01C0|nr:LysE family translocator [Pseudomonas aeruginosa]ALU47236.1 lysine transporter LysE [Pseudomonas aeruginosa]KSD35952.1 lysine transporter LysE [Pseudomonas aeruginosa]MBI8352908.1 LysE family translocator [Pseudomonas aeruginosa]MEC6381212.1 LysE family translocator [Pseudomonas aeruginosa]MWW52377.1 LysE family transporter [Pseudomonas aeruginosa]
MFAAFVLVASTHFAALLSPGPDFFLLVRAALLRGRRQADGVAAGIALANLLSMLLVLGLLASVPDSAHSALRWLQALGGLYFLWLAGQALLAQRRLEMPAQRDVPSRGGYLRGLRDGLLASSLNPKLPIFYAGLFGVLARFSLPGWALALCLAWMSLAVLCWDMALVRLLDRPRWRGWLQRRVGALDQLCGVLLLALGGWLVLAAL